MAIVKVYFRKSAEKVIRYVFGHTQPGDPVDSESCPPHAEGAITEFQAIRDQHGFKQGNNEVLHVIQSWNESDSKKLTPQTINELGRSLVQDYFKGHQFAIVTHTETGKVHNHIVIGTPHLETGKQIEHKFKHLHELRKINDRLCLEKGLQIPNQDATQRRARLPQNVQNMVRHGKQSWLYDTINKADVARHLATSYDQYVDHLDAFGIKARVEEKTITYFYPGRSRGKRGDKLGKSYDKPGLETQFKQNHERFQAQPEVRNQLLNSRSQKSGTTDRFKDSKEAISKLGISLSGSQTSHSNYTKNHRKAVNTAPLSERELNNQIISGHEIRKARRSISDYCKENNIALSKGEHGHAILRDKPYIVITGNEAVNTKNGVRGTLIDFVAAHHRMTLLQAIAKINGSTEPLAFENHFGAIPRKYTSFYIPKPDQMPHSQAKEHLSLFLKHIGSRPQIAEDLLRTQRAEVSKAGTIRFFAESDSGGALEFTRGPGNSWNEKKQGEFQRAFYQQPSKRGRMFLFLDPKSYLESSLHPFDGRRHRDGILVLMEPSKTLVDHYLKENSEVRKVQMITPKSRAMSQSELDFFGVIKQNLHSRGLEVSNLSGDRALSHSPSGLEI